MAPFIKVVVDRNIPLVEKAFGSLGEVTAINSDSFCAESVHDADALIIRSETKVDRILLDGSNVKFVGTATIGTAHIAGYSLEGRINGMLMVYKKFCDFFGMKPDWNHTKELPPPEITDIKLIPQSETIERIVHCVVERCYDISIDDTNLKRLSILPEKEQPGYFRKLRSVYRNRREFHNVTVQIPDENKALADIFIALGYGISKY